MSTPTLTPEAERLFAARPRTVRAMVEALAGVRGRFLQLTIERWPSSHSAPLGVMVQWPDGEALLGCGGCCAGGMEYQFVIWTADVPEAAEEWNQQIAASMSARNAHQALITAVEKEVAEARVEIWKRHRQEMIVAEEKNGKEWAEFEKWKNSQIGA